MGQIRSRWLEVPNPWSARGCRAISQDHEYCKLQHGPGPRDSRRGVSYGGEAPGELDIDGEAVMEGEDLGLIALAGLVLYLIFKANPKVEPIAWVPVEQVTSTITYPGV